MVVCEDRITAVAYAGEAGMQLEQLGANVMSIGRLVGFVNNRDKLHKAFKDSKLLMRDRVVWQAMGRFRTILDTQVKMDYLTVIVSDNTRLSQLANWGRTKLRCSCHAVSPPDQRQCRMRRTCRSLQQSPGLRGLR